MPQSILAEFTSAARLARPAPKLPHLEARAGMAEKQPGMLFNCLRSKPLLEAWAARGPAPVQNTEPRPRTSSRATARRSPRQGRRHGVPRAKADATEFPAPRPTPDGTPPPAEVWQPRASRCPRLCLRRVIRLHLSPRAIILEQTEGLRSHCCLAYAASTLLCGTASATACITPW